MRLAVELESKLLSIRTKVEDRNEAFHPKDVEGILILEAGYYAITGRVPSKGCRGLCQGVFDTVRNWYAYYDRAIAKEVSADEKALMTEPVEINVQELTLKELKALYPNIKGANSKVKFIKKLEENGRG